MRDEENGWGEHKRLVMATLERLELSLMAHDRSDEERFAHINETLAAIRQDIASLKVRSGVWGAVAGAIPVLVALIILYLETK